MIELNRLGLGTMGMSIVRNPEASVKTIHAALDAGITLFNTGEFYQGSESELIVGQALKRVNRDSYSCPSSLVCCRLPRAASMVWM